MENNKAVSKILEASNYASLTDVSDFVRTYIEKLVYNINMYVDADFSLGSIEILNGFSGKCELDMLAREAILDFLNLHNGLFVVMLSKNNICELSLDAPKQDGKFSIDLAQYKTITVIPVLFSYGTVKFFLCEL